MINKKLIRKCNIVLIEMHLRRLLGKRWGLCFFFSEEEIEVVKDILIELEIVEPQPYGFFWWYRYIRADSIPLKDWYAPRIRAVRKVKQYLKDYDY